MSNAFGDGMTIYQLTQALKHREQEELKGMLCKYGEHVDNGFELHFNDEQPIVAGYLFDEPTDIVIMAARVSAQGDLTLIGEDKECRGESLDIDPDEIFAGHLDYVTSSIHATMS